MGWPTCNTTQEDMKITEDPIWHGHTFHTLGLVIAAIFTAISLLVSFALIGFHATRYLKPWEQKHIIRILFMVPIYSAVSLLSFYYYQHSVYFEVIRDCYEALAIASFFSLMCSYLAPDLHQQKIYFRTITPKPWVWPMRYLQKITGGAERGWLRNPRSGLTWFNVRTIPPAQCASANMACRWSGFASSSIVSSVSSSPLCQSSLRPSTCIASNH